MAFPTEVSRTTQDFGTASTSHVVNLPTTTSGQLLLILAGFPGAAGAPSTPSGWTLKQSSTTDPRFVLFARVCDGTESGGTVDIVTPSAAQGTVHVILLDVPGGFSITNDIASVGGATSQPTQITTSWGVDVDVLWYSALCSNTETMGTPPLNFSNTVLSGTPSDGVSVRLQSAKYALTSKQLFAYQQTSYSATETAYIFFGVKGTAETWAGPQTQLPSEHGINADQTSHPVTMPTCAAGDLLLVIIASDGSATVATPTGWTQLATLDNTGQRLSVFAKVAVGNEGGTDVDFVTSSAERLVAHTYVVTNWYGSLSGVEASTPAASQDPGSVTPSWGSAATLWFTAVAIGNSGTSFAAPLDFGNAEFNIVGSGASAAAIFTAHRRAVAGTMDPAAWVVGSASSPVSITIAVRRALSNDRQGRLSWAEFEVPVFNRQGRLSWAEFEAPDAHRRGRLSWAELEVPVFVRQGRLSWAELEVPSFAKRGHLSWAELEVPGTSARGRLSWAEFEVPLVSSRGRLSWAELEVPVLERRGHLSWAVLRVPYPSGLIIMLLDDEGAPVNVPSDEEAPVNVPADEVVRGIFGET